MIFTFIKHSSTALATNSSCIVTNTPYYRGIGTELARFKVTIIIKSTETTNAFSHFASDSSFYLTIVKISTVIAAAQASDITATTNVAFHGQVLHLTCERFEEAIITTQSRYGFIVSFKINNISIAIFIVIVPIIKNLVCAVDRSPSIIRILISYVLGQVNVVHQLDVGLIFQAVAQFVKLCSRRHLIRRAIVSRTFPTKLRKCRRRSEQT